jgi:hypothetical protein
VATDLWEDAQLAALREAYPDWDIWYVRCYPNHLAWCARPVGAPMATINTDSPDHLAEEILAAELTGEGRLAVVITTPCGARRT